MIYDGHRNTNNLVKDANKPRMNPLRKEENNKGTESNYSERIGLLCLSIEFLKEGNK